MTATTQPTSKLALTGVFLLLLSLSLRLLVGYDPTPGWSGDPLELEAPIVGLTPMGVLAIDCLTLLASTLIFFAMRRTPPPLWQSLLLLAGAVPLALHARVLRDASMENMTLAASWLSAFIGAFAALQAARDPRLRRLMTAALLGLIGPLVIKGAVQCYIEQPESLRMFLADKERILNANGWTIDSPMAKAYERRLSQPEATAWIGLANVFATLAAATFTALASLTLSALRARADKLTTSLLALGTVIAAIGIYLAGAKGGYATATLGLALIVFLHFSAPKGRRDVATGEAGAPPAEPVEGERTSPAPAGAEEATDQQRSKLISIIAILLPFAALLAILLRGLLAERLHELSLYFRWFYIQTAARIFTEHPLLGTGPEGFKDAYMLFKPALSPEDVSSPHSIFFDLVSRLGLGGLALAALLIGWLWNTGAREAEPESSKWLGTRGGGARIEAQATTEAPDTRLLLLLIAAATAIAALLEQPAATITSTLARAGGLAAYMAIAIAVLRLPAAHLRLALTAAAIAGLTHTQIELTGVTPGANLWLFTLLALGATARAVPGEQGATARPRAVPAVLPISLSLASLILLTTFGLVPATRLDLLLRAAYAWVEDIPSYVVRARAIRANHPLPKDTPQVLAADLSNALHMRLAPHDIPSAVMTLRYLRALEAEKLLLTATAIRPADSETHHAAARLMLEIAAMDQARNHTQDANARADAAERLAENYNQLVGQRPGHLAWLGMVRRSRYELDHDPAHLHAAVEAWGRAAALAPHEPLFQLQLARTCEMLGDHQAAAAWARHALDTNADQRLDPLRQFSSADEAELKRLAGHQ